MTPPAGRIPASLKIGWAIWLAVWIPAHAAAYGVPSFLWFCALGNVLLGIALWREDALLLSMQALSVLLLQGLYTADLVTRAVFGRHLLRGMEYVFADGLPLGIRLLSLFHVVMPAAILFALGRLGYDSRALPLQVAVGWIVLAASLACGPGANVNGVWFPPGGGPPSAWPLYFALLCGALPLLVYVPTHLALSRVLERSRLR